MTPTVSVILTTHNRADTYLVPSIESVLSVNYRDFEVIVVDDGSTDGTEALVRRFGDALRYARQENLGLPAARNLGLHLARGHYVCFQDDDDLYLPHRFDEQVPLLNREEETGLVYGQALQFWEGEEREMVWPTTEEMFEGRVFDKLFYRDFIPIQTVLFRRELLEEVGNLDVSMTIVEDWEFLLRFTARYPVRYVARPLYRHRRHGGNLTWDESGLLVWKVACLEACMAKNPKEVEELGPRALRFLAKMQTQLARWHQKAGRGEEAHRHFARAIELGERTPKTLWGWLITR